jgi:4'-phosphopantetheinyl transferase
MDAESATEYPEPGPDPLLAGPPGAGELHVWWTEVPPGGLGPAGALGDPGTGEPPGALARHLDEATRARLRRMVRPEDRDRGVLAHSLARRLLAAAAGGRPEDVELGRHCAGCGSREHGKPFLRTRHGGTGAAGPQFNLTHSGRVVAVVLGPADLPVGIDVEAARELDWAPLRRNVFGDDEWAAADAAPDPERERFAIWARKEAAVKASGHGLALGLSQVRTVAAPEIGALGWAATLPGGVGIVTGWDLDTSEQHVGAVGVLVEAGARVSLGPPVVHRTAALPAGFPPADNIT